MALSNAPTRLLRSGVSAPEKQLVDVHAGQCPTLDALFDVGQLLSKRELTDLGRRGRSGLGSSVGSSGGSLSQQRHNVSQDLVVTDQQVVGLLDIVCRDVRRTCGPEGDLLIPRVASGLSISGLAPGVGIHGAGHGHEPWACDNRQS